MVAVYPVGIVCLFSALLFKHRKAIDPPLGPHGAKLLRLEETLRVERNKRCSLAERCKHAQRREDASLKSVRFLFVHYLPMYWYFEAIESVRRLLVTAVAVTVQPGSSTQLAFGLLTSIWLAYSGVLALRRGESLQRGCYVSVRKCSELP